MLHVFRGITYRCAHFQSGYAKLAKDKCDAPPEHVEVAVGDMDAPAIGGRVLQRRERSRRSRRPTTT